jgi:hypothetical protein
MDGRAVRHDGSARSRHSRLAAGQGGSVYDGLLDHTSILQFIASVFGKDGETYSGDVDDRMNQGIGNIVDVLSDDPARTSIPRPPETAPPAVLVAPARRPAPPPEEIKARYPELLHWEKTRP